MIPLLVTAHLCSHPESRPIQLDGVLLWALGSEMGAAREDGWEDPAVVEAASDAGAMPLARIESPVGWWWAASHWQPSGSESREYIHRRADMLGYVDHTSMRTLSTLSGPDKSLRIPHYRDVGNDSLTLRWTCVGDEARVRQLLERVPSVGARGTQGAGMVRAWDVAADPCGPSLSDYRRPTTRAVPVATVERIEGRIVRLPLRPPYWRIAEGVPCVRA